MNNKLNILALALLSLASTSAFSNETFNVAIRIETPENLTVLDEQIRQELFNHAVTNLQAICESASNELEFNLNRTETELEIESEMVVSDNAAQNAVLHNYLVARILEFVDVCNKRAIEENRNVSFQLDTTENDITLTIVCGEVAPEPTYWDSVKNTVSHAAQTVSTKASDAGVYIKDATVAGAHKVKDVTVAGAHKVSDAAYVVKEKAKDGIHTVAVTVADKTK